ncbi:MAG: hypothetical protein ACRC1W_06250, partial [Shewanella sp.]
MTIRHFLGNQWSKSILAHRLTLSLQCSDTVQQLLSGATSLPNVAHTIAALILDESPPKWLPQMQ